MTCFYYKGEEIFHTDENPFFSGCIGSNVGIPDAYNSTFQVAPNPVTDISKIVCNGQENTLCDYQIIDMTGHIVIEKNNIQLSEINIENNYLKRGLYAIKIFSKNEMQYCVLKFIIN